MEKICSQCGLSFTMNRSNRVVCSLRCAALRRGKIGSESRASAINKTCSSCRQKLPVDNFAVKNRSINLRSSECKECHKRYRKNHYVKNRTREISRVADRKKKILEYIREIKNSLSCQRCGEKHSATLQFHHMDPLKKEFGISEAVQRGYSISRIKSEMDKCEILCANCHFKEHSNGLDG